MYIAYFKIWFDFDLIYSAEKISPIHTKLLESSSVAHLVAMT